MDRSARPILHDMDQTLTVSTTQKKKEKKNIANLAVHVVNVLLIAHPDNTVTDTCPHGCTVRACIRWYCPGAWPITHNRSDMLSIILIMYDMTCYVYSIYMTCIALSSRSTCTSHYGDGTHYCITRNFQCHLNLGKQAQKTFRCLEGRTIDPEKFLYSSEKKRVDLENFRRNYKLCVGRQHRNYRNLSYTEN